MNKANSHSTKNYHHYYHPLYHLRNRWCVAIFWILFMHHVNVFAFLEVTLINCHLPISSKSNYSGSERLDFSTTLSSSSWSFIPQRAFASVCHWCRHHWNNGWPLGSCWRSIESGPDKPQSHCTWGETGDNDSFYSFMFPVAVCMFLPCGLI